MQWGYYLFYEANCDGAGSLPSGWHFDNHEPSTSAAYDLDGDGACVAWAVIFSTGMAPPTSGLWNVFCSNTWTEAYMTLTEAVTPTPTAASTALRRQAFAVSGACRSTLNDIFLPMELTANGRWYFKGETYGNFLYYDADCDGNGQLLSLWILGQVQPSTTAPYDLDSDQSCGSVLGFMSSSGMQPQSGWWSLHCSNEFTAVELTLAPITLSPIAYPTAHLTAEPSHSPTQQPSSRQPSVDTTSTLMPSAAPSAVPSDESEATPTPVANAPLPSRPNSGPPHVVPTATPTTGPSAAAEESGDFAAVLIVSMVLSVASCVFIGVCCFASSRLRKPVLPGVEFDDAAVEMGPGSS